MLSRGLRTSLFLGVLIVSINALAGHGDAGGGRPGRPGRGHGDGHGGGYPGNPYVPTPQIRVLSQTIQTIELASTTLRPGGEFSTRQLLESARATLNLYLYDYQIVSAQQALTQAIYALDNYYLSFYQKQGILSDNARIAVVHIRNSQAFAMENAPVYPVPYPVPVPTPIPPWGMEFTLHTDQANILRCDDPAQGGVPGARLLQCFDTGRGYNHGCTPLGDYGCNAWEGPGNGGGAACEARCVAPYGSNPPPVIIPIPTPVPAPIPVPIPVPPRPRQEFTVHVGNVGVARCDDPAQGGIPGARLVQCIDLGNGRNHGCNTLGDYGCNAWEGKGNGGGAACDARCAVY